MNFSTIFARVKSFARRINLAARVALLEKDKQVIMDALTHLQTSMGLLTKAIADQKTRLDALVAAGSGATQAQLETLAGQADADIAAINATLPTPAPPTEG